MSPLLISITSHPLWAPSPQPPITFWVLSLDLPSRSGLIPPRSPPSSLWGAPPAPLPWRHFLGDLGHCLGLPDHLCPSQSPPKSPIAAQASVPAASTSSHPSCVSLDTLGSRRVSLNSYPPPHSHPAPNPHQQALSILEPWPAASPPYACSNVLCPAACPPPSVLHPLPPSLPGSCLSLSVFLTPVSSASRADFSHGRNSMPLC